MPTGLSLCLAVDAACIHVNQLAHREQGPVPISSPMKLHRSLLLASFRVFISPVQTALLPGSPRIDGFCSLDYRSHRVGNKAECPKEQTHQLGNQFSNTPYYADSPKRHETVVIKKTKRTQSEVTRQAPTPNYLGYYVKTASSPELHLTSRDLAVTPCPSHTRDVGYRRFSMLPTGNNRRF